MKLRYLQWLLPILISITIGGCDQDKEDPGFIEFDFTVNKEACDAKPVKFASIRNYQDTAYVTFIVENTGTCALFLQKDINGILAAPGGVLASSTVPFGGESFSRLTWHCLSVDSMTYDDKCSGRIQLFRKNVNDRVMRWGEQDSLLLTRHTTGGFQDSCDLQTAILKHENKTSKSQRIHVRANSVGTCTFYVWVKLDNSYWSFPPYFPATRTLDSLAVPANPTPGQMSAGVVTVPAMTNVVIFAGCLDKTPPGGDFCGGTVELYLKD